MQTITTKQLVDANRAALRDYTLIAQSVVQQGECAVLSDPCVYSYQQYGCAIGVALDDETKAAIRKEGYNNGMNATQIQNEGFVQFEDLAFAMQLQAAHDNWASLTGHDNKDYCELLDTGKPLPYLLGEPDPDMEDDFS